MKERIVQFLSAEKLSAAEFADKIGVQRSSISHILNGRNYPSANFIQKMLVVFPGLNSRWLMIGTGEMYLDQMVPSASDTGKSLINIIPESKNDQSTINAKEGLRLSIEPFSDNMYETPSNSVLFPDQAKADESVADKLKKKVSKDDFSVSGNISSSLDDSGMNAILTKDLSVTPDKEIEQILFFFKDKTFSVYRPS